MIIKIPFILIFLSFGGMGLYQVFAGLSDIAAARHWHSVSGVIDSVTLTKKTGTQKRPSTIKRSLHYRYSVKHISYEGQREYFGVQMTAQSENAGGFKEGAYVDVYYNPSNPQQSVLKPRAYRGIIAPFIISIIFLITSGYLAFTLRG